MRYLHYPRRFSAPAPSDYDTEEEYQAELDAYDYEMILREDTYIEKARERAN